MYSKCFTMIEMVVVIVIIATLAAVATPMYFNYVKSSRAAPRRCRSASSNSAFSTTASI